MKILVNKHNRVPWLYIVCICIMIIYAMVPYLSRNGSLAVQFAAMFLAPVLVINSYFRINSNERSILFLIILYLLIETIYKLFGISSASIDFYFTTVKFFWFYISFFPVKKYLSYSQKIVIIIVSGICFSYTLLTNITYSQTYDHYISMYQRVSESNAANTAYTSMTMLIVGCLYSKLFDIKNIALKIVCLVGVVFGGYYLIFIAERGIAFLLTIMLLILITINVKSITNGRIIIISFAFVVFFFFVELGGLSLVLNALSGLLPERLAQRVLWIDNVLNGGSTMTSSGTLSSRLNLSLVSIRTFFSNLGNFFLGVGDHRNSYDLIGNHCQWIDVFARYGILCGILLNLLMYRLFKSERGYYQINDYNYRMYSCLFLVFYLRGLLGNVIAPAIGAALFVIIPAIYSFKYSIYSEEG